MCVDIYLYVCICIHPLFKNLLSTALVLGMCSTGFTRWHSTGPVVRPTSPFVSGAANHNTHKLMSCSGHNSPNSFCVFLCAGVGLKHAHTVSPAEVLQCAVGSSLVSLSEVSGLKEV